MDFLFKFLGKNRDIAYILSIPLLYHKKDFGIKIKGRHFFATSHGKSTCDATGGILKRLVMRHCIRSPPKEPIT